MNEKKLSGMIGLAVRARRAAAGMDASRILIQSGKCGVLLLDGEAAANTRKKAEELCMQTKTAMMILPAGLIKTATGKNNMVMAIQKGSFAEELLIIKQG